MSGPAETDDCHERLHRAGWSIGEIGMTRGWLVTGTYGENVIRAVGRSLAEAYRQACEQAAAAGILGYAANKPLTVVALDGRRGKPSKG
jgi:hypothetical protein